MEMRRTITATEFRAKCLALFDEVADTGQEIVVTKRGVPVARVVRVDQDRPPDLRGSVIYASEEDLLAPTGEAKDAEPPELMGSILWQGDVVAPIRAR